LLSPGKTGSAVLLCGADENLLHYRGLVLERCGFEVERALRAAEAAEWLRVKQFQLAVMCHTLQETALHTLQILCWRSRVPVYRLPVLATPEELIGAVTARVKTRTR
jgi:DNA-binding response OmpR family regulator